MRKLLVALVFFGFALFASSATAQSLQQSLQVMEPAAGAQVSGAVTVMLQGPPGAMVRLLVDDDEIARLKLDPSGKGTTRFQAPESDAFRLQVEQIDSAGEVVAMTSLRLKGTGSAEDATGEPPPPPPPGGEKAAAPTKTPVAPPPPPPPPEEIVQDDAVNPDMPTPDSSFGAFTGTAKKSQMVVPRPTAGDRVVRVLVEAAAGLFAVPIGWIVGVTAYGVFTNFEGDIDTWGPYIFLGTGALAAAGSTYVTGALMDGDGSFWATLAGAFLLSGLSYLTTISDNRNDLGDEELIASMFGSFLAIPGAIVGYELTSVSDVDYTEQTGVDDAIIGIAPTPDGGFVFGVSGRW